MDALVRQRVNEILNEKIAMGAGEGGYGTKKGARKAVATKRRIAKARAAPVRRAPARRRVCAAGEGYGGYGTAAGAKKRAENMKAKCVIADLKAENKELKAEVKEVVREVKALEKVAMKRGAPPRVQRRPRVSYIEKKCATTGYRSKVCKQMYPQRAKAASPAQLAARERFAKMSRAISAIMRDHRAQGIDITRQEAACLLTGDSSKKCKALYPNRAPAMVDVPMEVPVRLVKPNEIVPREMLVGSGRRMMRGRGDMGYGTVIY